jgi:hypothetical protein
LNDRLDEVFGRYFMKGKSTIGKRDEATNKEKQTYDGDYIDSEENIDSEDNIDSCYQDPLKQKQKMIVEIN